MCFITDKTEKEKIADRDIEVFKIVTRVGDNTCESLHHNFRYEYGKVYEQEIMESEEKYLCWADTEDIDEFPECFVARGPISKEKFPSLIMYGEGFHSYCPEKRAHYQTLLLGKGVVKCIIPKGSKYMINRSGCVISNSIIIYRP